MRYKNGETITCPHCRAQAMVTVQAVYDGWTKTGKFYACSHCDEKLMDVVEADKAAAKHRDCEVSRQFADFLGTNEAEKPMSEFIKHGEETQFCKDCVNYIEHPFATRC